MSDEHRPCERQCQGPCKLWKHHSRFRGRQRRTPHGTVWEFNPVCKACEQKERNERKNADRPFAIIQNRAAIAAHKAGTSREFFMVTMNYQSLVPVLRALMGHEGVCQGCGHSFLNERDIQIEHLAPPRNDQDWARLHARNIRLFCASCNGTKSDTPFETWLDEQEDARLSNLTSSKNTIVLALFPSDIGEIVIP